MAVSSCFSVFNHGIMKKRRHSELQEDCVHKLYDRKLFGRLNIPRRGTTSSRVEDSLAGEW